jgi:hypothetical protein
MGLHTETEGLTPQIATLSQESSTTQCVVKHNSTQTLLDLELAGKKVEI